MMSYLKSNFARRNVHLSSPAQVSVNRAYHKILRAVKVGSMQTRKVRGAFPTTLA